MAKNVKAVNAPAVVPKMTMAQAVRDVFIASINKGQFPLAIIGAIVLLIVWRIPEQRVGDLSQFVADKLVEGYLLGYLLFVLTVFAWFFHAQWLRRRLTEELNQFYEDAKKVGRPARSTGAKQ